MSFRLSWHRSLEEIPREEWDRLAAPLPVPILEWEWLRLLESSGSVCPETGWIPLHATVRRGRELVAAAALYVKVHSEGEFVWDYVWVDVANQLGTPYYPKLVGMSPATPVSGYRFLCAPGEDEDELTDVFLEGIERLSRDNALAGVGFAYADPVWQRRLARRGYLAWRHQSFLWENPGLGSFEEYLSCFDHNQRRNVQRERKSVRDAGFVVRALQGEEIRPSDLSAMYRFYEQTNAQFGFWAAKYLNEAFFSGLVEYRHRLLLFAAHRNGSDEVLAMSLLLRKGPRLFGRYWGASEHVPNLHFELCYYAPLEWAIEHGVESFDPGIGGPHKVRRGFRAVPNHSLHRFSDPRLQGVMATHLAAINEAEQESIDELNRELPVAKGRR